MAQDTGTATSPSSTSARNDGNGAGSLATSAPAASQGVTAFAASQRILSMDQYRGYCVAGMFVVNFLGGMAVTHQFLKHNNTHFSWADSIMPGFLFACGFSFRLSVLKRVPRLGRAKTYLGVARRSLALVLISLVAYGVGGGFDSFNDMTAEGLREFAASLLKADLWEVLAIIGVLQLLLLPVIGTRPRVRLASIVVLSAGHFALSAWFNYRFVYGLPTWMDGYFGLEGKRAWDGGCFGLLSWAIPMLAGTLVYDLMSSRSPRKSVAPLLAWACGLMLLGYGLSCFTTLYDVTDAEAEAAAAENDNSQPKTPSRFADSPVIPPLSKAAGRPWTSLLAEPPFVVPPPPESRKLNYWMMDKRVVTQSFILFSTGFAIAAYVLFIVACDLWGLEVGVFRTFGQNALAAYIIHYPIKEMVHAFTPDDSPVWWTTTGLALFFLVTYMFVRFLERNRLYLKL